MPGEESKWDIGFWDVAYWDRVFATFKKKKPEDAYTGFLRRFYNQHEVALVALTELLDLHQEKP